jgi:hypothetical protein
VLDSLAPSLVLLLRGPVVVAVDTTMLGLAVLVAQAAAVQVLAPPQRPLAQPTQAAAVVAAEGITLAVPPAVLA